MRFEKKQITSEIEILWVQTPECVNDLWDIAKDWVGPGFNWNLEKLSELCQKHSIWILKNSRTQQFLAFLIWQDLPDVKEILALATKKNQSGHGLMSLMLKSFLDWNQGQVIPVKEVWLEVHEGNAAAIGLYESLGFQQVGRRTRYYSDLAAALLYLFKF